MQDIQSARTPFLHLLYRTEVEKAFTVFGDKKLTKERVEAVVFRTEKALRLYFSENFYDGIEFFSFETMSRYVEPFLSGREIKLVFPSGKPPLILSNLSGNPRTFETDAIVNAAVRAANEKKSKQEIEAEVETAAQIAIEGGSEAEAEVRAEGTAKAAAEGKPKEEAERARHDAKLPEILVVFGKDLKAEGKAAANAAITAVDEGKSDRDVKNAVKTAIRQVAIKTVEAVTKTGERGQAGSDVQLFRRFVAYYLFPKGRYKIKRLIRSEKLDIPYVFSFTAAKGFDILPDVQILKERLVTLKQAFEPKQQLLEEATQLLQKMEKIERAIPRTVGYGSRSPRQEESEQEQGMPRSKSSREFFSEEEKRQPLGDLFEASREREIDSFEEQVFAEQELSITLSPPEEEPGNQGGAVSDPLEEQKRSDAAPLPSNQDNVQISQLNVPSPGSSSSREPQGQAETKPPRDPSTSQFVISSILEHPDYSNAPRPERFQEAFESAFSETPPRTPREEFRSQESEGFLARVGRFFRRGRRASLPTSNTPSLKSDEAL